MKPLPKVSAAKYGPPPPRAAKVIMRPKGSSVEGVMFQGQHAIKGCSNCGHAAPVIHPEPK